MRIGGLQRTTLVDFPGKVAATVFTQGCNLRCPYCHNPELVLPTQFGPTMPEEEFFDFLGKRQGKLDGICITGGEPTLQADLQPFLLRIKEMGFLVKLDSNGSRPDLFEKIFADGSVDYIAMDIKSPLERYHETVGVPASLQHNFEKSIALIINGSIDYEFRTTVTKPLLSPQDMPAIGTAIKGAKRYFLQNFVRSKHLRDEEFVPFTDEELAQSRQYMLEYVEEVGIR